MLQEFARSMTNKHFMLEFIILKKEILRWFIFQITGMNKRAKKHLHS